MAAATPRGMLWRRGDYLDFAQRGFGEGGAIVTMPCAGAVRLGGGGGVAQHAPTRQPEG